MSVAEQPTPTLSVSASLSMGKRVMELGGKYLGMMRDANSLLGDAGALHARMAEDGYLLLRGLHNTDKVKAVRKMFTDNLTANEQLDPAFPPEECVVMEGARGAFLGGSKQLTRNSTFLDMVESPEIMGFFADFLQGDILTFDFKWMRLVGPGDFSGAHYDIVYMGRGTQNLYTCWTPITDVEYSRGPLCVLVGANHEEKLVPTYGQMDVDRDHVTGAFSNDPIEMVDLFGGQWKTTEYKMGDVVIFGMHTMHGALDNTSNRFRLSCDCRYQRADEPVDERWVGENPPAHYAWMKGETVPMEEARKQWKV